MTDPMRSDYHADHSYLGSSALKCFMRSPLEYHAQFIARTIPPIEPTRDMQIGTAVHLLALEQDKAADAIAVAPEVDRRTKDGKERWAEFVEASAGKLVLDADAARIASGTASAITQSDFWRECVATDDRAVAELPVRWTCHYGVKCKALFDLVLPASRVIVDVKTTTDPSPEFFGGEIWRRGYHIQAAHYLAGASAEFGEPFRFVLLAAGKSPPHEVVPYEIDAGDMVAVAWLRRAVLCDLAGRMELNEWRRRDTPEPTSVRLPQRITRGYR